jgi:hypothetical protein
VAALVALVILVAAGFTLGPIFDKRDRGVRKERQVSSHQRLQTLERAASAPLPEARLSQPTQPPQPT